MKNTAACVGVLPRKKPLGVPPPYPRLAIHLRSKLQGYWLNPIIEWSNISIGLQCSMLEHWVGRNTDLMMPNDIIDGEAILGYDLLRMRAKTYGEIRY